MELEKLCSSVQKIAKEAGAFILNERQGFVDDKVEWKSLNSLVSYVDKEAERMIVQGLKALLPESGFITEEDTIEDQRKEPAV